MNYREFTSPVIRNGGKGKAAGLIWQLLGNGQTYIDPFCGSAIVPLRCPYEIPKVVLNDLDCFLVNFWRSVQNDPDAVSYWADYPTSHVDLVSRREWMRQSWPAMAEHMKVDPWYFDAQIAGLWVWCVSNSLDLCRMIWPEDEDRAAWNALMAKSVSVPHMANGIPLMREEWRARRDGTAQGRH